MARYLNEEKILENKNRFIKIFEDLILPSYEGADLLLNWIKGTDFFEAPASVRYHLSEKGGLCFHSLNVYDRLIREVVEEYGEDFTSNIEYKQKVSASEASLALIALTHDLCKANFYTVSQRNVKNEKTGQWEKQDYYAVDEKFVYGHGEKSVFLIQNFIKQINLDEAQAIRFHMGGDQLMGQLVSSYDYTAVYNECALAFLLNCADRKATFLDEVPLPDDNGSANI